MELRTTRKAAAVLAASAALATGMALTVTGTAAAADRYSGPELSVEQGDFSGKNVKLNLTNPNPYVTVGDGTTCTSALLDGGQALEALVAYNAGDYGKLVEIMLSPGLNLGPSATNSLIDHGPNSDTKNVQVADGVYAYLGTCGGWESVLNPDSVGVSFVPVIVPDGIGSIGSVLDFGSTALEAGVGSADLLPLLGG